MSAVDLQRIEADPVIAAIDAGAFPKTIPLDGILANDARLLRMKAGEIVVREGDYGSSAFLIMSGKVQVVINPPLTNQQIGRREERPASLGRAIAQIWKRTVTPEVRDVSRYSALGLTDSSQQAVFLQDFPAVLNGRDTAEIGAGNLFGELAALGRTPRAATVICSEDAQMLEIRWQGLRELRRFDAGWKRQIDANYRNNALQAHLQDTPLFKDLDPDTLQRIADATLFETYGSFDWSSSFQRAGAQDAIRQEPVIVRENEYHDGLLLIRAGFARISVKQGAAERTLTYLQAGDSFGLAELYKSFKEKTPGPSETTLRAIGYVDALRVPTRILDELVFPKLLKAPDSFLKHASRPLAEDSMQEWEIEERFVNGTMAMLIDLNKCVRCDDCVRACASTHGGNPRFIRHGKIHDHWMVANACMHCADPVCMIGCPTGAIHRSQADGTVVINDDTCIGCGTCANACPYNNIRLVEIRDLAGLPVQDEVTGQPIRKATKCDLCAGMPGGPACARACPHGALQRVDF